MFDLQQVVRRGPDDLADAVTMRRSPRSIPRIWVKDSQQNVKLSELPM
jgi:hypothetical protein